MRIDNARDFFEALAKRGREPRWADLVGTWEFDVVGTGRWTVTVDRGDLTVSEGVPPQAPGDGPKPTTRLRLTEEELLRLARGTDHENLFMAAIRGALAVDGELAFAQKLQAILPVREEEWRAA
jgi:hypothetical protein